MGTWGGTELSKNFLHWRLKMFRAGEAGARPCRREGRRSALEAMM